MYYDSGDFDERLFIDSRDQLGTPSKVPHQTRNYYHLRGKNQSAIASDIVRRLSRVMNTYSTTGASLSVPQCVGLPFTCCRSCITHEHYPCHCVLFEQRSFQPGIYAQCHTVKILQSV